MPVIKQTQSVAHNEGGIFSYFVRDDDNFALFVVQMSGANAARFVWMALIKIFSRGCTARPFSVFI